MNIAFRVDASKNIGIGHLMRCFALSEELKKQGHSCIILSKILDEELLDKIKKFDVKLYKIKSNDELDEVVKFSKKHEIDWIITDSYDLDSDCIEKLKKEKFKVLSIDDNAIIHYHSDVVVNQNVGSEKLEYSNESYTKFLLGPKYAILRDELLRRDEKKEKENVEKILVTLGGTDSDNFTLKIMKPLEKIDEKLEIIVIVGLLNPHYEELKNFAEESDKNFKLVKSPNNMADLYIESDIAISAGGSSCYELSYFGIPNLIITVADNQLNIAKDLDKRNVSVYLGRREDFSSKKLKEKVLALINNESLRKQMVKNGMNLVDGKGKERIVDFMYSYQVKKRDLMKGESYKKN